MINWISVGDRLPNDDCHIKLTDGSILKNVWPQSDGDYYWRCREQGEMFIREEAVTHWAEIKEPEE